MTDYDTGPWHDLFVATAGAAAALAGLVFVAVSINITRILELKGIAERGLQTVLLLLGAVLVSVFALAPESRSALGVEELCVGAALIGMFLLSAPKTFSDIRGHPQWIASRVIPVLPGSMLYLIGGISLLAGSGGGLRWILAGIVGALIGGVINAWVLLVEILR